MVGLTEFSASANLEVHLDQSSLRRVNRELSAGIDDPTVSAPRTRPDGGRPGGGISRGQRADLLGASRQQLSTVEELVELAEERNEILENRPTGGGGGFAAGVGGGTVATGTALGVAAGAAGVATGVQLLVQSLVSEHVPKGADAISGRQAGFTKGGFDAGVAGFKNVLDPTGTGEALLSNVLSGFSGQGQGTALENLMGMMDLGTTFDIDTNVEVGDQSGRSGRSDFDPPSKQEVESFVESELKRFQNRLERQLGGGTSPRTGGGGAGGRLRR